MKSFWDRFIMPIEKRKDRNKERVLGNMIRPFILRRLKTDPEIAPDLPEKMETKVYCNLTKEQATLYQAVVDDMLQRIRAASGMERRGLVLSALTRLKQVCNHPAHLLKDRSKLEGRSGKLMRLVDMLEEVLGAGEKALVFTQFAEMGSMMKEYLERKLNPVAFLEFLIADSQVPCYSTDRGRMEFISIKEAHLRFSYNKPGFGT